MKWTLDETTELRRLHSGGLTLPEIAKRIGRSYRSVRSRAWKLGLRSGPDQCRWQANEAEKLRELWPGKPWREISEAFPGRSRANIRARAQRMGVFRQRFIESPEMVDAIENLSETEVAYIAGFIDGEGTIIARDGHINLSAGNTCRNVIDWLASKVGGHVSCRTYPDDSARKPCWVWSLTRTRVAEALLLRLAPYLLVKTLPQNLPSTKSRE